MTAFTFPSNYGIPLLSATLLSFECIVTGFAIPGRARGKVFNKDFMKANFDEVHFEHTQKEDITTQDGYPDMGSGRFSEKLSYADWLYFNRAQRVHYNFIE
jgi:glutathione S-transferase